MGMIGTLLFADDMMMMAETREPLLHNVEVVNAAPTRWGLKVNWSEVECDESGERERSVM